MKIKEYNDMIKYITRPKEPGYFKKEVQKQIKNGTYGPGNKPDDTFKAAIDYAPKKVPNRNVKQTKSNFHQSALDNIDIMGTMVKYGDIDPEEKMVMYDSATGLVSNKKKDIAFKDAVSARKHNEVYEKYVPDVQKKKEFVRPKRKEDKPFTRIANNLGKKPIRKISKSTPMPEFKISPIYTPEPYVEDPALKALGRKVMEDARRSRIEKNKLEGIENILGTKHPFRD